MQTAERTQACGIQDCPGTVRADAPNGQHDRGDCDSRDRLLAGHQVLQSRRLGSAALLLALAPPCPSFRRMPY